MPSPSHVAPSWRLLSASLLFLAPAVSAQVKPVMTTADYSKFETVGGDALSPDGKWYAYRISKLEQDGVLYYRRTDQDGGEVTIPMGLSPVFSRDSRYLAWFTEPSIKEREQLTKDKKPVQQRLTVINLASGVKHSFDGVRAFSFTNSAEFMAVHGYTPTGTPGKGANLRIVETATGNETNRFGDVSEYRWSDDGAIIAMAIATGGTDPNGIQLFVPKVGAMRWLETSSSNYHQMLWRKGSSDLVVMKSIFPATETGKTGETVIIWRNVAGTTTRSVLDSTNTAIKGHDILSYTRFSNDGRSLIASIRGRVTPDSSKPRPASPSDSASTVQIWHSKDVQLFPAQARTAVIEATRPQQAIWSIADGKVTLVPNPVQGTPSLLEGWNDAVDKPNDAYNWGTMFGRRYNDVYLTDLNTGKRDKILEKVRYSYESTDGRYLLSFDGKDFWSYEIATAKKVNITTGLKTSFANLNYDTPTDVIPPYGMAGWGIGDKEVYLYDQYDLWRISPDGTRRDKLTNGRTDEIVHRIFRISNETPGIDATKPLWFSIAGDRDRKSGYARLIPGGTVQQMVYLDKAVGALRKADSSETYIYRAEDRADSPDVFTVGKDFTSPRQLTHTNTFLKDYAWTREELITFKSEAGIPLKGVLLYPVNYDPSKKYPMIVYTYEILSNTLHTFTAPSERSYYNQSVWTMNGYFVFMPDIIFKAREPGISTIQSVRAGVKAVAAKGIIDPKRVGHIGHSWGGYEAAFLGTHGGDFLATTIAGASITDLVSFMGQIHWGGGNAEADHAETGQARMEVPYWEDPAAHRRNSAIENVQNMTIPMLMAHGNKDGTVEFFQATEFWNFARRAGKQVVLLVYDGEDHGFSRKSNQIDYQRRILEWFGYYLKGEPAQKWITDGIKASDEAAEVKRVADKGKAGGSM